MHLSTKTFKQLHCTPPTPTNTPHTYITLQTGKLVVLVHLLTRIIASGERVVVVSTSTQALNIVATICNQHAWSTVRIDGATDATRRQDIVTAFNRCNVGQVFLLSTRAGGAGLNLIGASRLIMVDFDWNPACDLQGE